MRTLCGLVEPGLFEPSSPTIKVYFADAYDGGCLSADPDGKVREM